MNPLEGIGEKLVPSEEPRWHASLAVVAAVLLYIVLPSRLIFGPVWAAPLLIGLVLVPLSILAPTRHRETIWQRVASVILIAILNFFNIASVVLLVVGIVHQPMAHNPINPTEMLTAGAEIWATNILVFALWFWELDSGGPESRAHVEGATAFSDADFLFPQMVIDARLACARRDWKPLFIDYLYLGFTNALAFSPTDVMPLSRMAKMLMMLQALISFITVALIVSRSVGILS